MVPDSSSTLNQDQEATAPMKGNHIEMCKVFGLDDPKWEDQIYNVLSRWEAIALTRA